MSFVQEHTWKNDIIKNWPKMGQEMGKCNRKAAFRDLKSMPAHYNFSCLSKIDFQNKGKY